MDLCSTHHTPSLAHRREAPSQLLQLPPEIRELVLVWLFRQLRLKPPGSFQVSPGLPSDCNIFLVCGQLYREAKPVFVGVAKFLLNESFLLQQKNTSALARLRCVIVDGHNVRFSIGRLRRLLPAMHRLDILYCPRVTTNFDSLTAINRCQMVCCQRALKELLLYILFCTDDTSNDCWISAFVKTSNRANSAGSDGLEVRVKMIIETRDGSLRHGSLWNQPRTGNLVRRRDRHTNDSFQRRVTPAADRI